MQICTFSKAVFLRPLKSLTFIVSFHREIVLSTWTKTGTRRPLGALVVHSPFGTLRWSGLTSPVESVDPLEGRFDAAKGAAYSVSDQSVCPSAHNSKTSPLPP